MKKVFIVAARRTAIGKFMGSLAPINPGELGAIVIKELIKEIRTAILGPLLNLDFRRIKNGKN